MDPQPEIVDAASFEESDIVDVRAHSLPAGHEFFHGFTHQFGQTEDDWEDEDDDDDGDMEPECRQQ